jgi:hypothetical protein
MRYKEKGCVHMDFHRTMNATIDYLVREHGDEFLKETFRRTAHDVYRSIWLDLQAGSPEQLIEHWRYYFDRENAPCSIKETADEIKMTVARCPAVDYLQKNNIEISPYFCLQTVELNKALSEKTPFKIDTEIKYPGCCEQIIRKRQT